MTILIPLRAITLSATLAAATFGTAAQVTAPVEPARLDIPSLQSIYLRCADESTRSVLDSVTFAYCSAVGDALRDRAFDGSFERLIAWWHGARTPRATESDTAAAPSGGTGSRTDTVSLQTTIDP